MLTSSLYTPNARRHHVCSIPSIWPMLSVPRGLDPRTVQVSSCACIAEYPRQCLRLSIPGRLLRCISLRNTITCSLVVYGRLSVVFVVRFAVPRLVLSSFVAALAAAAMILIAHFPVVVLVATLLVVARLTVVQLKYYSLPMCNIDLTARVNWMSQALCTLRRCSFP